ncbi:MAG: pilus assembly protein HicB [Chthoniobacteraceae bacterium]
MKTEDAYLKFVKWSDDDAHYVGNCPDLFPWGGVCHSLSEEECYGKLCVLVREEIQELSAAGKVLSEPHTRPMREALIA